MEISGPLAGGYIPSAHHQFNPYSHQMQMADPTYLPPPPQQQQMMMPPPPYPGYSPHMQFMPPSYPSQPQHQHQQYTPHRPGPNRPPRVYQAPARASRASQTNRPKVLQLPSPQRSIPNYTIPLPNDYEGLLFALNGKFDCGDEIVADAATRILEAVAERCDKLTESQSELPMSIIKSQRSRNQRLKVLQSSWMTSSQLASSLVSTALGLANDIEAAINDDKACALTAASRTLLKVDALTSITQSLEKWTALWSLMGLLVEPKVEKAPPPPKPRPSIIIENPPPPPPRGVGRPRLQPVISIGDFVDTLPTAAALSIVKPASTFDIIPTLHELILKIGQMWAVIFIEAEQKAIELNAAKQICEPRGRGICTKSLVDSSGNSVLLDSCQLQNFSSSSHVFRDPDLPELFVEAVKEAEFLIWKEQRRSSQSGEASQHPSSNNSGTRGCDICELSLNTVISPQGDVTDESVAKSRSQRFADELRATDIAVSHPSVALFAQLMTAACRILSHLGQCRNRKQASTFLQIASNTWLRLRRLPRAPSLKSWPWVFRSVGSALLECFLEFAWELGFYVREDQHIEFISMTFDIATSVMICFGHFVSASLFPSVSSKLSKVLQLLCCGESEVFVPVDTHLAQAAILVALVEIEDIGILRKSVLSNECDKLRFWKALLYCAFGASVAQARARGLVSDIDLVEGQGEHGVGLESDSQILKVMLSELPRQVEEKASFILKQKRPRLDLAASQRGSFADHTTHEQTVFKDTVVKGSFTQPLLPNSDETIDTYQQRPNSSDLDQMKAIYEDLVYACAIIFSTLLIYETSDFANFLQKNLSILTEITFLSRSSSFGRVMEAVRQDNRKILLEEFNVTPATTADDATAHMD